MRTLREETAQEESRYHHINCMREVNTHFLLRHQRFPVLLFSLTLSSASPSQIIESQMQRAAEQSKINQSMDLQVRRTALRYETEDISAIEKPQSSSEKTDMHKHMNSCFITDKQMIPERLF